MHRNKLKKLFTKGFITLNIGHFAWNCVHFFEKKNLKGLVLLLAQLLQYKCEYPLMRKGLSQRGNKNCLYFETLNLDTFVLFTIIYHASSLCVYKSHGLVISRPSNIIRKLQTLSDASFHNCPYIEGPMKHPHAGVLIFEQVSL